MATWHGYIHTDNLNLAGADYTTLTDWIKTLGPGTDPQPANLIHWVNDTFEALFDTSNIDITAFKTQLATILGVGIGAIDHSVHEGSYAAEDGTSIVIFSNAGTDYLLVSYFGGEDLDSEWMDSGDECRGYLDPSGPNVFYVDVTTGNDGNDGLLPTAAWQTIAKVNGETFTPSDSILFKRGETWREELVMPSSGIAGNRIVFDAYGSGANPLIDASVIETGFVVHAGSVYVKAGFTPTTNLMWQVLEDGERLIYEDALVDVVQGSWFLDDGANNLYIWSTDDADPDTHTIERPAQYQSVDFNGQSFIDFKNIDTRGAGRNGVDFSEVANAQHINVIGCNSSFNGNRGFSISGAPGIFGTQDDIIFQNCTAYDNNGEQFWIGAPNCNIVNCTAYNCGKDMSLKNYSAKPGPAGGGILVGRAAEDCYVRGCYVYDIYYGVGLFVENQAPQAARTIVDSNLIIDRLGAAGSGASTSAVFQGTGSLITNNVFVSAGNTTSVYFNLNSTNEDFIHNSIYRLRNPNGQFAIIASSATGLNLQNNSVYFINGGADGYVINIGAGAQAGFTSDNNCFYYTGINGTPYTWGGVGNYATLALWAAQSGTDASSVEDDPLYVNPGADDLHLQVGSPCRGEGAVGTGVTEDYDGVTRGSPPDIGAYEYVP